MSGARRRNANDVDLNRNYPDFDDGPHPDGYEYQDETLWMMDLAREYPFTMAANFHTGSEVVNYPWDTYQPLHPDDDWWRLVCHEYTDHVHLQDTMYMTAYDNGIVNGYVWYTIYSQTHTITVADREAVVKDVQLAPINTGLEEFRVFDVYPNPTSGLLFVKASGITEYRITNLLGQTLLTGVLNGETIDISVLSNGFYLLKIKNSIIKVIVNQ